VISTNQWDQGTTVQADQRAASSVESRWSARLPRSPRVAISTRRVRFVIHWGATVRTVREGLLTPQVYPDMRLFPGGPPKRPYDITGWTLSYQMGVNVDRIADTLASRPRRSTSHRCRWARSQHRRRHTPSIRERTTHSSP